MLAPIEHPDDMPMLERLADARLAVERRAALARAGTAFSLMWQTDWGGPPVALIGHLLPDTSRCLTPWEAGQPG